MARTTDSNKGIVTYKIEVPVQKYQVIKQRAEAQHLTMKEYGLHQLMDDTTGTETIRREIIKIMPHFYNCVNEIGNDDLKKRLIEMGERLCRL